ncbi:MAG TPA: dihydrofolate reductase family protein, partial [Gammaproteobacteria bacterium]
RLAGALLIKKLIDEIVLYIAPCLLGNGAKGIFDIPLLKSMQERIGLDIQDMRLIDHDIRIIAKPMFGDRT